MASNLSHLHRFIIDRYDLEELRTLCFDKCGLDDLRGEGKTAKARELILRLGRRHPTGVSADAADAQHHVPGLSGDVR
jgi:hypothetical protein